MSNTEKRIDNLEIKLAHQDQLLHELNEVLQVQYDKIDMLEARLKRLQDKVNEGGSGQETPIDKPPHY